MASTTATVEKPQAGHSVPVTLSEGQATVSCKAGDIESMQMTDGGKLLMTFKDGASITVNNFQEFASKGSILTLADGTTLNTVDLLSGVAMKPQAAAANDGAEVLVGQPPAGQTAEIELAPGHKYNFAFDDAAKESVTQENGALIITFQDGGKLVLKNFSDALDASDPVQVSVGGEEISLSEFAEIMKLADAMNDKLGNDQKPVMAELREEAGDVSKIEPAAGEQEVAPESQKTSMQDVRQDMTALAEQLAGIEPAAGGQSGGGSARAGGFGFQSAVDPANVLPLAAIGPIGPTALQFGLPTPVEPYYIPEESEPVGPPSVVANLGLNDAYVKEDGTIFVPVVATIGSNGDGDEVLTLTITGVPPTWNPVFTGGGTYDPGTGTWTITMPPGTNYTGGITVTPPAESDVDLPNITATVTVYDPDTGGSQTATDTFDIIVDAVADKPHVDAPDNQGVRGTPLAVTITGGLGSDQDGSESITHYTVTGLPEGFTFNKGTYDPVTGTWTFQPNEITGLLVTPPAGYHGSIPMVVTIYNKDTPTDRERDTADNTNSASDPFTLTWTPKITPPDLTIDNKADFVNGQVKEDRSITIPVKAVLSADAVPGEYLTVTITGIPSSWNPSFTSGTYDANTGTWTVTLPPNTNFDGSFTVSPPKDSDVDLTGLTGTATATQPTVNNVPGLTASDSDGFGIIVDAVADKPHVDAPDNSGVRGTPLAVTITGGLGSDKTDGSESVTHYTVKGLPEGFTFNKGTYDPVTKLWTFTPEEINAGGLFVTPPAGYHGTLNNLVVTIYNKETPTDGEYDTSDNTNSASDPFTLTWTPKITPPDLTINNQADFVNGQVKEDGSVTIPVKAVLSADAVPGEYLTVTITGIPSSWNPSFTSGTYDPATGTWTVTLPPNTNFDGSFTVSPPKDSDVDLTGLTGTATATQPTVGDVPGLSASDSDGFGIIVDAVADKPHVDAPDNSGLKGTPLAVNITGGLGSDQDGSESITHYTVSGLPEGFTFNKGTYDPVTKVWTFTPDEVKNGGLTVTPPANYHGTVKDLVVTIYNKETPTDGEYDTIDNTNSATDGFKLTWTPKINPPDIKIDNQNDFVNAHVKEDKSVTIPVTATLGANAEPGEYLTVTITGIPTSWGFSAPVGSYDPATGTWTVTLPANTNLSTALTFTPPAQSDVDLSGLVGTVVATQPSSGLSASDSDTFGIIVDAVADEPTVRGDDNSGSRGQPLAVNIQGDLGVDKDNSEVITHYTVTGLPNGFTFNKGAYDPATNTWTFLPNQITGLTVTPPANYQGSVNLTVTVYNKETVTDGEYDTTDNTNSASDPFTLTWNPKITPPDLTINNENDFVNGKVKEDSFVDIPVKAVLSADAIPGEYLTVTITGIPSSWGFSAPVGTYNAATGTWTVTLPANTNLNTVVRFTPPADSDIDLSGLVGTATSTQPASGGNPALTASDTDSFGIIVDAVADKPTIKASAPTLEEGHNIPVTINAATTDRDGSEVITGYSISGLPTGYSFNKGTYDSVNKVWNFTPTEIVGLQIVPPANGGGANFTLKVTVYNTENPVSDGEYDTSDNNNSATTNLDICIKPDTIPTIVKPDAKTVDETNMGANPLTTSNPQTVGGQLQADFKDDAPGTFGANGNFGSSVTGLKSNGVAVDVTYANGVYTGKAGNVTVFTLQVNPNGSYSFTLLKTLDHPNTSDHNDNIALTFGATATDSDGDTVATTITINVKDDGVDAVNDVGSFDGGMIGYTTAGNVMTNDDLSQDGPNTVSAIRLGSNGPLVQLDGSEKTIVGQFGTLTIKPDGSYTYTTTKLNGTQDTFTYTLRDGDGDTDTATLTMKGIAPTLIVGENVNDVPGSTTPWEVGNGNGKIEGGAASDILIGDVGGSSMQAQNKDYNIVLMLDVSGSMGSKTDPNSRISLLVKAVKNLVGDFHDYQGGEVRINIIGFSSGFAGSYIFTAGDDADYADAIQYLNSLTGNGFTNYEAAMQDALAWHNGTGHYAGDPAEYRPISGAENISYFISDGQPNRYVQGTNGSAGSGDDQNAWNAAMAQINGTGDNTNEIAMLKAISNVIAVGINIDSSRLDTIDSDGDAIIVRNASDLDTALQGASPLTQLSGVGNDILNGGEGNDIIFGDSVNTDKLATAMGLGTNAGSGWDVFARLEMGQSTVKPGWTRADTLEYIRTHLEELGQESQGSGGAGRTGGHDEIRGGAGNDIIFGQEGNDHIWGGAGDDILYGGSGKDTFHFEATPALNGVDTIKDFSFAQGDALDLSAMLTAYNPTQDAIDQFVFATTVNGNTVVSVDVTGSGNIANAQAVAILQGVTGVTNVEDLLTHNSGGNVA